MDKLKKEYFEFGPWLTEIKSEEDITHQFMDLKDEILETEFAFKVPLDKERSTVKEGELLYDRIIAVEQEGIKCYRIIDDAVYKCQVPFEDMTYVRFVRELLYFNMDIGTESEQLHFHYLPIPESTATEFADKIEHGFVESTAKQNKVLKRTGKDRITLLHKIDSLLLKDNIEALLSV